MSEDHVELYWRVWVLKEEDGDSFNFLKYVPKDKGKARMEEEQSGEEQEQEIGREQDEVDFPIHQGIPLPYESKTSVERTKCPEKLVPTWGSGKLFHTLVKLVDNLEVSST